MGDSVETVEKQKGAPGKKRPAVFALIRPKPRLGSFTKVISGTTDRKALAALTAARAQRRSLRSQPRRVGFGRPYQARPQYGRELLYHNESGLRPLIDRLLRSLTYSGRKMVLTMGSTFASAPITRDFHFEALALPPWTKYIQHGHRSSAGDHGGHHSIPFLHSASLNLDSPQLQ